MPRSNINEKGSTRPVETMRRIKLASLLSSRKKVPDAVYGVARMMIELGLKSTGNKSLPAKDGDEYLTPEGILATLEIFALDDEGIANGLINSPLYVSQLTLALMIVEIENG